MKLLEAIPKNKVVKHYIDRYQYFAIPSPSFLKAVPNGKFDCWIAIEGNFDIWDFEKETFQSMRRAGIMPATNHISLLKIPNRLICLNVKLHMRAISLNLIKDYPSSSSVNNLPTFLNPKTVDEISQKRFIDHSELTVDYLDRLFLPYLNRTDKNQVIETLFHQLESMADFTVSALAEKMDMSNKSLERLVKKYFALTPKDLWNILRFEKTTSHLLKSDAVRFIEALDFGYYDQSHFIKECRRIAGTTPKNLFDKMKLPTNDLYMDS